MILIAGIPTEAPVELAIEAAQERGISHHVFDQRDHAESDLVLEFDQFSGWKGRLNGPHGEVELNALSGIYVRMMDDRFLPGLDDPEKRRRAVRFHQRLNQWFDVAPGRIASRPSAMMSNMSKPYQALVARRAGFFVPDTLITNDPARALAFVEHCRDEGDRVVYKSISGTRSIVQIFVDEDKPRIGRIRWCPTQFQRQVCGADIRVHVIGEQLFATRIESSAADYRYARRQSSEDAVLSATTLPTAISRACVELSGILNLPFTGIDLRVTPQGDYYCFEANPCPAYSYYECRTGAPISNALVCWLAGIAN